MPELASVTIDPLLALGKPFFPSLQELHLTFRISGASALNLIKILARPSLRLCRLYLNGDDNETARFAAHLAASSPHLEELIIDHASSSYREHFPRSENIWQPLISRSQLWPKLRILKVSTASLPATTVHRLLESTELHELHLRTSDKYPFVTPRTKSLSALRVISVEHLSDHGYRVDKLTRDLAAESMLSLLRSVSSSELEKIVLTTEHLTTRGIGSIAVALSDHVKLRKIEARVQCHCYESRSPLVLDFGDLSPLYRLSLLQSLEIVGPHVNLRNGHVPTFGNAWPDLRTLRFPAKKRTGERATFSILDFTLFALHCPNLEALTVPFDPSSCPRTAPNDLVPHPRRYIAVDASYAVMHGVKEACRVAAFLRAVFPDCAMRYPYLRGRPLEWDSEYDAAGQADYDRFDGGLDPAFGFDDDEY